MKNALAIASWNVLTMMFVKVNSSKRITGSGFTFILWSSVLLLWEKGLQTDA